MGGDGGLGMHSPLLARAVVRAFARGASAQHALPLNRSTAAAAQRLSSLVHEGEAAETARLVRAMET